MHKLLELSLDVHLRDVYRDRRINFHLGDEILLIKTNDEMNLFGYLEI